MLYKVHTMADFAFVGRTGLGRMAALAQFVKVD
jgi:hypothetical protein